MGVKGRRRKGRRKLRWMDSGSVNIDLRDKGLSGKETQNQAVWRQLVRNIDPHIEVRKNAVKKKMLTNWSPSTKH